MTREDVSKALSGKKENKHLKLVIGGPNPEKHFLNGAPISKESFEGIVRNELKMGIKRTVNIYIDGKALSKGRP